MGRLPSPSSQNVLVRPCNGAGPEGLFANPRARDSHARTHSLKYDAQAMEATHAFARSYPQNAR
eukprot:9950125-Lingulodinium_polyedra.AAC.1